MTEAADDLEVAILALLQAQDNELSLVLLQHPELLSEEAELQPDRFAYQHGCEEPTAAGLLLQRQELLKRTRASLALARVSPTFLGRFRVRSKIGLCAAVAGVAESG